MDAMAHFGGGIGNVLRVQAFVDGLPGFAAIVGSKRARGRDGDDHALRIAGIVKDAMQTHATSAWLPLRTRAVAAKSRKLLPGFAAVIGALDNLPEPAAGLRGVNAVGTRGRSFHVINLPAGKMRAADGPFFAFAVRRQNERTFPCPHQHANFAHEMLLSLFSGSLSYQEPETESNQLRKGSSARKRASRKYRPSHTSTPK